MSTCKVFCVLSSVYRRCQHAKHSVFSVLCTEELASKVFCVLSPVHKRWQHAKCSMFSVLCTEDVSMQSVLCSQSYAQKMPSSTAFCVIGSVTAGGNMQIVHSPVLTWTHKQTNIFQTGVFKAILKLLSRSTFLPCLLLRWPCSPIWTFTSLVDCTQSVVCFDLCL